MKNYNKTIAARTVSNEEVQVNHAKFEALSGIVAAEPEPEPLVLAV